MTAVAANDTRKGRMTNVSSLNGDGMELQESEGSVRFYSSGHETHCQRAFGARRFNFVKATQMTATGGIGIAWHGARLAAGARLRAGAWRLIAAILASVLVLAALPARADDDLPARVGRLASVQGDVFHAPDEHAGDWAEIGLNYPIAEGDNLWVQGDGRAEVDYGGGQFRLAGDTNLHVSRLDDRQLALFIAAGRVIVRVRVLEADDSVRIDTPASQIALMRPGLYRIDVASDSPHTTVVVREGEAQVTTPAGAETGIAGADRIADRNRERGGGHSQRRWHRRFRHMERRARPRVRGAAAERVRFEPDDRPGGPRRLRHVATLSRLRRRLVPDRRTGLGALSLRPLDVALRVGLHVGRQRAWGYAPFHYGRWAYIGGRWGWCPGMYVARPLWAPALVAWYGGSGWAMRRRTAARLRLGAARLARAVRPVVGSVHDPLLSDATTGPMRSTSPSGATRYRRTMRTGACRAASPRSPRDALSRRRRSR